MLSKDPNAALDGVKKTIEQAQRILSDPDDDGLKELIVQPVLKLAVDTLTKIYEPYKPKRNHRN